MSPDAMLELLDVLTAVDLADYELFKLRKAVIADLGLDEATIVAKVRIVQVMRLAFHGRRFDLEIQGVEPEPAVVIGALDFYERWHDLIAWPIVDPSRVATMLGAVAMLGEHQLDMASPWGPPLPVYRSPLTWLHAGCIGVVPLDPIRAARAFIDCDGALVAEDVEHARELALARAELVDRSPPILIPDNVSATRAAA